MKAEFPNASESVKRLNPHLFVGGVATHKPQPNTGAALGGFEAGAQRGDGGLGGRIEVGLIAATHRRLDSDNLAAGFKPLRDAIARYLGTDDNDDAVEWQYGQVRCSGDEGTIVTIRIKP